jgi:hypothetical protein
MPAPTIRAPLLLLLLSAAPWCGCEIEFDDETKALVKKPELLSVVLEPPEAAPGAPVRASYLMADAWGIFAPGVGMWLPLDPRTAGVKVSGGASGTSGAFGAKLTAELKKLGITPADLARPTLTFRARPKGDYTFDADGLARHPLSLVVQTSRLPADLDTFEELSAGLERAMNQRVVKLATRTLVVSTRPRRCRNPAIKAITADLGGDGGAPASLVLVRHDDADLSLARLRAADAPLVVDAKQKLTFRVTRAAGGLPEDRIRYQWISTGGDFGGTRRREQGWEAPDHRQPRAGEKDQTGQRGADPRTDPNLHPVWLILRSTGGGCRGQSWFELYVRVRASS